MCSLYYSPPTMLSTCLSPLHVIHNRWKNRKAIWKKICLEIPRLDFIDYITLSNKTNLIHVDFKRATRLTFRTWTWFDFLISWLVEWTQDKWALRTVVFHHAQLGKDSSTTGYYATCSDKLVHVKLPENMKNKHIWDASVFDPSTSDSVKSKIDTFPKITNWVNLKNKQHHSKVLLNNECP